MEGLGICFIAVAIGVWWKVPPRCDDEKPKERVAESEHPGWSLVVQETLKPVLDEAASVGSCPCLRSQPHLERCEWADGTEPCLCNDHGDSRQVSKPEPQGIDPPPGTEVADDREHEPANDERDGGEVQCEHRICQQLIWRAVAHFEIPTTHAEGRGAVCRVRSSVRPCENCS